MRPLVHIGYHKTASTWLQRHVFCPEMGFDQALSQREVDAQIVTPHDLDFDASLIKGSLIAPSPGQTAVISSENLSGHPFYGGRDCVAIAHRLKAIVPDATILVVLRSQRTILPSVYMQYLKRGGTLSFKQFFAGSGGVNYPGFDPAHFQYDRLIGLYQTLFPKVCVLTQEGLAKDPQGFVAQIFNSVGMPTRCLSKDQFTRTSPSHREGAIPLLRAANRLRRSTLNPAPLVPLGREGGRIDSVVSALAKWMPQRSKLQQFVERELAPLYRESNAKLNEMTGGALDLSSYP